MKRLIALSAALALFASTGIVGCGEETERAVEVQREGPGGTTTERVEHTTEQQGENPPPPTGISDAPVPATTP